MKTLVKWLDKINHKFKPDIIVANPTFTVADEYLKQRIIQAKGKNSIETIMAIDDVYAQVKRGLK